MTSILNGYLFTHRSYSVIFIYILTSGAFNYNEYRIGNSDTNRGVHLFFHAVLGYIPLLSTLLSALSTNSCSVPILIEYSRAKVLHFMLFFIRGGGLMKKRKNWYSSPPFPHPSFSSHQFNFNYWYFINAIFFVVFMCIENFHMYEEPKSQMWRERGRGGGRGEGGRLYLFTQFISKVQQI